jgi:hypothetical protein
MPFPPTHLGWFFNPVLLLIRASINKAQNELINIHRPGPLGKETKLKTRIPTLYS